MTIELPMDGKIDVAIAAMAEAQRLIKAALADADKVGDSIRKPLLEHASASLNDAQTATKRAL